MPEIPSSEGIRTSHYKYFRYRLINAPAELYDLNKDPLETINLAGDIKYKKVLNKLSKLADSRSEKLISEKLVPDEPDIAGMKF